MPSRALIVGAGVAGLALAHWLPRHGWQVTVVEKADSLRAGGQNVDVHDAGREVIERMGLLDQVRSAGTGEKGICFVDDRGSVLARFPVSSNDAGSWTRELEILRGDLVGLLFRAAGQADIRFGDTVTRLEDRGADVLAHFEHANAETFDLVVAADGLGSPTRGLVFGAEPRIDHLGLEIAWATIPRQPGDQDWWCWYTLPGGSVQLRPDPHGTMRAMLTRTLGAGVEPIRGLDRDEQLRMLRATLGGGGWQTRRVLDAVERADDFYLESVAQVHAPRWSSGRVALVGDAAHCASPVSGMGTSLALAGACVLAGEVARHPDVRDGLVAYEQLLRPWVEQVQSLPPGVPRVANPRTRAGVRAFRTAVRIAGSPPARWLAAHAPQGPERGFELPAHLWPARD